MSITCVDINCPRPRNGVKSSWEIHESLSQARVFLYAVGNSPSISSALNYESWALWNHLSDRYLNCFWTHLDGDLHKLSKQQLFKQKAS